ncbi:MAG: ferredoxin [Bdellovibrionales bacterium]
MADKGQKWGENAQGKFYVDQACIACDACVTIAPDFFSMDQSGGHAFVTKQPSNPETEDQCREAMEGCPVEAIGNDGQE